MQSAILVIAGTVLFIVAYGDIRTRRIPNTLSLAIAALGLVRIIVGDDIAAARYTLAAGAVTFTVGFFLYWRGVIGGGDAKLIAAVALLVGHQELPSFLFLMSLCGGMLAFAGIAEEKLGRRISRRWRETAQILAPRPRSTVPYGVAVAAAGVLTLMIAR